MHCCPLGTNCDPITYTCRFQSEFIPMWRKEPAVMAMAKESREPMEVLEKEEVEGEQQQKEEVETGAELVIPCDDHTSCKDGNTCCPDRKQDKWFCCPLSKVNIHNNTNTTSPSVAASPSPPGCFHWMVWTSLG